MLFEDGHADLLGGAGIDGGFVDDGVAGLEQFAHRFAGPLQRGEVRPLVAVDRGRHCDDVDIAVGQIGGVGGVAEVRGRLEFFRAGFEGAVLPTAKFGNPRFLEIEADRGEELGELDRQGQTYIAETDDA